jgi:hypothetical protein
VTIGGDNFAPLSNGAAYIGSVPARVGAFTTDSTGAFAVQIQIPGQTAAGTHELYAVGTAPDGSVRALGATITVESAPGPPARPDCVGTLSGTINGALQIGPGMVCTLTNARVNGLVTVGAGAVFEADASTLNGGVVATAPTAVALCGDQVNGDVTVRSAAFPALVGGSDSPLCAATTITGLLAVSP